MQNLTLSGYCSFFTNSINGAFRTSVSGRILDANKALVKMFGYKSKAEILKTSVFDLYAKKQDRKIWLKKINKQNNLINSELDLKKKNGQQITVLENAHTVKNKKNKILYYEGTLVDITKQKQAEENYKILAENRSFGIIVVNKKNILFANKKIAEILGVPLDKLLLMPLAKIRKLAVLPEEQEQIKSRIKERFSGKGFVDRYEMQITRPDKSRRWISVRSGFVNFNHEPAIQVIINDITERKKIDQAKSDFLSLASHQLRTPLSTINWYAELLFNSKACKLDSEQAEYVKEIYRATKRMVNLVDSILNASKLELGTFIASPEKINFSKIIRRLLKYFEPQIQEKNLTINQKFGKNLSATNDPELIQIILQNLLSNAVKYTPENGKIKIVISRQVKRKNIFIKITNTGQAISRTEQSHLFDKFFRTNDAKNHDVHGKGLGLYIAKLIIDYMGGKIWFKSKFKKGTSFYIIIPRNLKI